MSKIAAYDFLIVGAGFAGAVVAERLAAKGARCLVIDRRSHVAGNAYDHLDAHGVLVHAYGPHVFHTNSPRIFEYLSRFTQWRPYEHRVLAQIEGRNFPFPINRTTLELVYETTLDETGARELLERVREPRERIVTSEDHVLAAVGRRLYETFFQEYTRKQWGVGAQRLNAGVAARIPVRTSRDDRYFTDRYQAMPRDGYTAMFERILASDGIDVRLETAYADAARSACAAHTIFTGPIDEFFDYRFGRLPYRSLRFEFEHRAENAPVQPVGTINFPREHAYTRVTEFAHLTGQFGPGTTLVREYPGDEGDPYYPVPAPENDALYERYAALAQTRHDVTFVGRLAQYRYLNMDQVTGAAIAVAERLALRAA